MNRFTVNAICKHLRWKFNEQISADQFIRSGQVETAAHKRQSSHRLHRIEPLQVRHPIPSRTDACALLQSALKEPTAMGPASQRRLYQARLDGGYIR
jgi:hypothetical protein